MKVSCWQHHFLLLPSAPARQAGYAEALGGWAESRILQPSNEIDFQSQCLLFTELH
jgi:hypothetical protein